MQHLNCYFLTSRFCSFLHMETFYFCGSTEDLEKLKVYTYPGSHRSLTVSEFLQKHHHLNNLSHQPYFPLLN